MDVTYVGEPTRIVAIEDATQIGHARRLAQLAATGAGFDATDAGRVALVATELSTNVLKHARSGEIHISVVQGSSALGVEVTAVDRGPGFNLADCLPDGFSTGGTRGEGLGAVKRQSNVMDIYSDHRGSVVMSRTYPKGSGNADIRFGATQQRMRDETVCGDGWGVGLKGDKASLLLIDGLGHGIQAHDAAVAGLNVFRDHAFEEPVTLMASLNSGMTGTRGGAAAVAQFDGATGALRYSGIGNIAGGVITLEGSRGLASHPGIVGVQARRAQGFDFPDSRGKLLVMYSDGLQSRWNLKEYPGLAIRHPAVVTAVLFRDFNRERDDVTLLAMTLGSGL